MYLGQAVENAVCTQRKKFSNKDVRARTHCMKGVWFNEGGHAERPEVERPFVYFGRKVGNAVVMRGKGRDNKV